jgi:serine/threonine-protein kinase
VFDPTGGGLMMGDESISACTDLPLDVLDRIDQICNRFENAWNEGEQPRIEDYIGEIPEAYRPALILDLLAADSNARRLRSERQEGVPDPAGSPQPAVDDTLHAIQPGQVLHSLLNNFDSVPRILLPDTTKGTSEPLRVDPASPEMPPRADRPARVQLLGEIARGGMGVVLRGRDTDIGRDLAVKVLLDSHMDKPDLVRRFVEEAQIGGQLQHPGVVPVYELGTFGDRRPYFTMKLVKGQTLTELLAERKSPTEDLPRLLSIFEQVCQTMAYAHARSVIHRDLKPSNVMVGSFGEVQVMDWGLAKVLRNDGVVADAAAGKIAANEAAIVTARVESDHDLSQAGLVLGTPAYMAPEQARGEIDRIDERADVFALGSILCELLTGQPAFVGRSGAEIHRKAALGDHTDAMTALERSGASGELIALARSCLAREREDRPRQAAAVAERITAYLVGVQEKLRATEIARATEQAQAEEARRTARVAEAKVKVERRALRLTGGLAASVLGLIVIYGGAYTAYQRQRAEREAGVDRALREADVLYGEAKQADGDPARWAKALEATRFVEQRLADARDAATRRRVEALAAAVTAEAQTAVSDRNLPAKLADLRTNSEASDLDYANAFRQAGIDPRSRSTKGIRRSDVVAVVAAIDHWSWIRREKFKDEYGANVLSADARAADSDPWRDRLRRTLELAENQNRLDAVRSLARSTKVDELPPVSLNMLGAALRIAGDPLAAESLLRRAQGRHPGDLWLNWSLAQTLEKLARRQEAIRYYMIARSIRPESGHELAHALRDNGEIDDAIAVFQDVLRLQPDSERHLSCLRTTLQLRGRAQEAVVVLEAAVAALRDGARLRPEDPHIHRNLGAALRALGKPDEAIAEFQKAARLEPDDFDAHLQIGAMLSDDKHDYDAAIAEFRKAVGLRPAHPDVVSNLLRVLRRRGRLDEAIPICKEALRFQPRNDRYRNDLVWALIISPKRSRGDYDEALGHAQISEGLAPNDGSIANTLALAEYRVGHWAASIAAAERSMALRDGGDAFDWFVLAMAHGQKGGMDAARKYFDKAVAWTKQKDPDSPELVQLWTESSTLLGQPGPH